MQRHLPVRRSDGIFLNRAGVNTRQTTMTAVALFCVPSAKRSPAAISRLQFHQENGAVYEKDIFTMARGRRQRGKFRGVRAVPYRHWSNDLQQYGYDRKHLQG